jgi:hypothetical protein
MENWEKIEAAASFAPGMSSAVREMVVNQEERNTRVLKASAGAA